MVRRCVSESFYPYLNCDPRCSQLCFIDSLFMKLLQQYNCYLCHCFFTKDYLVCTSFGVPSCYGFLLDVDHLCHRFCSINTFYPSLFPTMALSSGWRMDKGQMRGSIFFRWWLSVSRGLPAMYTRPTCI